MKKKIIAIMVFVMIIFTGVTCFVRADLPDSDSYYDETIKKLKGTWECEENPLNDPENYTGYIKMKVEEDGKFRIFDGETDKNFLKGIITVSDDNYLFFSCRKDKDFNPPNTWTDMSNIEMIRYKFKSEEKLYLTYEEDKRTRSTLIFGKGV